METIISQQIFAQLSPEEQQNWHYHKEEIALVDLEFPDLSVSEKEKVLSAIEDTYGKVIIFWAPGSLAPTGIPSITSPQSLQKSKPSP